MSKRYVRETDGPIVSAFLLSGRLYVMTESATYRVRKPRKRWRDKNKPSMAQMIQLWQSYHPTQAAKS